MRFLVAFLCWQKQWVVVFPADLLLIRKVTMHYVIHRFLWYLQNLEKSSQLDFCWFCTLIFFLVWHIFTRFILLGWGLSRLGLLGVRFGAMGLLPLGFPCQRCRCCCCCCCCSFSCCGCCCYMLLLLLLLKRGRNGELLLLLLFSTFFIWLRRRDILRRVITKGTT